MLLHARVWKTDTLPICNALSKFAAALLKVNSNARCPSATKDCWFTFADCTMTLLIARHHQHLQWSNKNNDKLVSIEAASAYVYSCTAECQIWTCMCHVHALSHPCDCMQQLYFCTYLVSKTNRHAGSIAHAPLPYLLLCTLDPL